MPRPLAVSVGEPGGVGPAVSASALCETLGEDRALLFGDARWLRKAVSECRPCVEISADKAQSLPAGAIGLVDTGRWSEHVTKTRHPNAESGLAQLRALAAATDAVLAGHARALVTAPVSKEAISLSGTPFLGHTEYLAARAGLADDDVTMMFIGPKLSVSLVTTHLPIDRVSQAITQARVERTIRHTIEAMGRLRASDRGRASVSARVSASVRASVSGSARARDSAGVLRIVVCGLNPHAGEGGLLGTEDRDVIAHAIASVAETLDSSVELTGPTPAEAALRYAAAKEFDAAVAMYHDQATVPSKLLDWGQAVNVTWGLPFVRTSVDHGVAYDAAEAGSPDDSGMRAAIALAQSLTVS